MTYSIEVFDAKNMDAGDALCRLHRDNLDAIVVRNVFDSDTLNHICSNLPRISGDQMVEMVSHEKIFGYTFPRVHATADDFTDQYSDTLEEYFNYSGEVRRLFPDLLGISIEDRLKTVFEKMAGGLEVKVPGGINGNGSFTPFTIRSVYPRRGGLPIHNDRDFLNVNKQCYNHLSSFLNMETQASYFLLLSAPDEEGSLRFYEEYEEDGEKKFRTSNILVNNENVAGINGATKEYLMPGDLIVFLSSKIFHQVDDFDGLRNRLTIGGYTGMAKSGDSVYFWS